MLLSSAPQPAQKIKQMSKDREILKKRISSTTKSKVKYVYLDKYQKHKDEVAEKLLDLNSKNEIQQLMMEELDKDIQRTALRTISLILIVAFVFLIYFLYNL